MHPEQAIAALRFDPLLPVWLLVALGVARGAGRRARGPAPRARHASSGSAPSPCCCCGSPARAWCRKPARRCPISACWWWTRPPPCRSATARNSPRQPAPSIAAQAAKLPDLELRTITVPERRRRHAAVHRDRPGAGGHPALAAGRHHRHHRRPDPRHPDDRARRRAAERADPRQGRGNRPPAARHRSAQLRHRRQVRDAARRRRGPRRRRGRGGTANLTIRRDGDPSGSENVPVGVEQQIELPITRAGPTVVELSADKLPGEVSTLNNRAVVEINGVRDRLRVLLISGEPHPGERTWRRLLKADPSVDLVHFTILRPPEKDDLTPLNELALIAFPVRELFLDKIGEFDLIILDRFQNRGLLPLPYLAQHRRACPRRRRAAAVASGRSSPARPAWPRRRSARCCRARRRRSTRWWTGAFRPRVTDLGQRHPVTEGLAGANPAGRSERAADLGLLVPPHRPVRRARRGADAGAGRRPAADPQPGRARAARRCCCPTRSGCGRAAMTAAARRPSCCAGWRTG